MASGSSEESESAFGNDSSKPVNDGTEGDSVEAWIRQQLLQAAKDGDSKRLETILKNDLKGKKYKRKAVNCVDRDKLSPLHHAVRHNHLASVEVLIEHNADVNQKTMQNYTPLHLAVKYFRSGDDILDGDKKGVKGSSGIISYLVEKEANCFAKDSYGSTALHLAAMKDNRHLVEEFQISKKFNKLTQIKDKQGMIPLHVACLHGSKQVTALLLSKGDAMLYTSDNEERTPLHLACLSGSYEICEAIIDKVEKGRDEKQKEFINKADISGSTALENAVQSGEIELVKFCIKKGAKVAETRDAAERLIRKSSQCDSRINIMKELFQSRWEQLKGEVIPIAARLGRQEIIELLRTDHNNAFQDAINLGDKEQRTPLLVAARYGHVDTVKYFLEFGADIFTKDKHGKTALFLAAENNHTMVVEVILEKLNKIATKQTSENKDLANKVADSKSSDGSCEIGKSDCEVNDKTEAEISKEENSRETNVEDKDTIATEDDKQVDNSQIKQEWDVLNQADNYYNNTPLHIASQKGHNDIVEKLIVAGAQWKKTNFDENLPLHLAATNGSIKIVQYLIKTIAESKEGRKVGYINAKNDVLNTPLHLAARSGHKDVVKYLIEEGAEVMARHVC
ncbi:transient receptor potential cation channel subfamily A member 1 homolog [Ptychodera flava]|uniref:transient receptor potential cation channel subfamily A member 1 homolog n=1 Tax=Ptychodera flava TaxID=63121 RepID=UPI00396A893A